MSQLRTFELVYRCFLNVQFLFSSMTLKMTNPCLRIKHGKNIPCVKLMFDGITFLILLHVSNVLCMLFAC